MADEVTPKRSGPKFAAGFAPKNAPVEAGAPAVMPESAPIPNASVPVAASPAGAPAAARPSAPKMAGGPKFAAASPLAASVPADVPRPAGPKMAGGPKMAASPAPVAAAKPAVPASAAPAPPKTPAAPKPAGLAAMPKPANPNLVIQRPLTQIIPSYASDLRPQASGAAVLGGIRIVDNASVLNVPNGVTRREFLNYVWGASMALLLAESSALTLLFAFPRFRPGEFGGKIKAALADFPQPGADPIANNVGKFWMVNTTRGLMAHYKICTHLGCIFKWDEAAKIFACPCHGSQFNYDGTYRAGPAPRGLDHFQFELLDAGEKILFTAAEGQPVDITKYPNAVFMDVNTGGKITGIAR